MKAIVLCAGYGTRMGDLTREISKPMLPIQGKPLLEYTVRYLKHNGFDDIAINLHFKPELISDYFGTGAAWGVTIHYAYEETLLGTAGALRNFTDFLAATEDFLVIYGDLLVDEDLGPLLEMHRQHQATGTLVVHQRPNSNSLIQMDDRNRIIAFVERPSGSERQANSYPWVNSGIQLLNRRILNCVPQHSPADLPRDVYVPNLASESFYGKPLTGYRCALDSPNRYIEAQQAVAERRYKIFP